MVTEQTISTIASADYSIKGLRDFDTTEVTFTCLSAKARSVFAGMAGAACESFTVRKGHAGDTCVKLGRAGLQGAVK